MSGLIQGLKQGSKSVFLPVAVDDDGQLVVVLKSGNVVLDGPITVASQVEITNDTGNAVAVSLAADELGSGATGIEQLPGGAGLLGWLSGIFAQVSGIFTRLVRGQQPSANSISVVPASDAVLKVSGSSDAGFAPTAAPLSVSGIDSAGLKRNLLTEVTGALRVTAERRSCVGRATLTNLQAGADTLLTNIPQGAVAALIQADGASIRMTLDGVTSPGATVGTRVDDGVIFAVDSSLTAVRLRAQDTACAVQIAYFDRA